MYCAVKNQIIRVLLEAPPDHNFRSPWIRELLLDNDAIALGGQGALFLFLFSSLSLSALISSLWRRTCTLARRSHRHLSLGRPRHHAAREEITSKSRANGHPCCTPRAVDDEYIGTACAWRNRNRHRAVDKIKPSKNLEKRKTYEKTPTIPNDK
jgi:hypothetical protein